MKSNSKRNFELKLNWILCSQVQVLSLEKMSGHR